MHRVLSTYRYSTQPLTSALLAEIGQAGITSIEIYCTPVHLKYRSQEDIRTLSDWLAEHHLIVHSMHSPTERDLLPASDVDTGRGLLDIFEGRFVFQIDAARWCFRSRLQQVR